jgi:N-methylhydantoinase B
LSDANQGKGGTPGYDGRRNAGYADDEVLYLKVVRIELKPRDTVRIATPGGGAYGLPAECALKRLADDSSSGRVCRSPAERDYGPEKVTAALRARRSATT